MKGTATWGQSLTALTVSVTMLIVLLNVDVLGMNMNKNETLYTRHMKITA